MEILFEIYQRLLAQSLPKYMRQFYSDFKLDHRCIGIIGARGVGKTTFLLHYLRGEYGQSRQALYVSADNLYFVEHTLVDLVDTFVKGYDGRILCIDEIHKYKNWNQELKNIYDSYPQLQILFSGSSSIDLVKGKYDLSRRVILKTLYGFSFREYLEIQIKKTFPILTFESLLHEELYQFPTLSQTPRLLGHLKDYWRKGYYPTFLELPGESAYHETLRNIIDKVVFEDITSFYSLKTPNLDTLKKILYFFATSQPGTININKLSNSLQKDFTTISEYVQILRDSGLLRFLLMKKSEHALVRNAEKIYLDNTNLLWAINEAVGMEPLIGTVRELFVLSSLQNSGKHVFYSDQGDISCDGYTFEIGGKGKSSEQLKGVDKGYLIKDDVLVGDRKSLPLYLFGFLS